VHMPTRAWWPALPCFRIVLVKEIWESEVVPFGGRPNEVSQVDNIVASIVIVREQLEVFALEGNGGH
jgi:hypothetical protein